jgi:Mg/Co/Ni transporter MgtE
MPSLDLLIVLVGLVYGYSRQGKEDLWKILLNGLKIGLLLGIAMGFLGLLVGGGIFAFAFGAIGVVTFVMIAFIITIEFIIGAIVGDLLESAVKK